jgi:hypothetical protein
MRPPSTLQLVFAAVCGSALFWLVWLGTPLRTEAESQRATRLLWAADERALASDFDGAKALLRECIKIEGHTGRCAERMSYYSAPIRAHWHAPNESPY